MTSSPILMRQVAANRPAFTYQRRRALRTRIRYLCALFSRGYVQAKSAGTGLEGVDVWADIQGDVTARTDDMHTNRPLLICLQYLQAHDSFLGSACRVTGRRMRVRHAPLAGVAAPRALAVILGNNKYHAAVLHILNAKVFLLSFALAYRMFATCWSPSASSSVWSSVVAAALMSTSAEMH
ncbi:hypothetical protein NM688_g7889 [Phlebia brevispora]|uniref:Uncharacterized protein n=1 Tax=Phlebia brevispora TaxID=194682 RepID=A0ACC1RZX0_9APHY|nr:hypothetical protein NM688_g7889 [Phlebia brevispora]